MKLLGRTTCPHCWHSFAPEDVLWVAAHADLLGDARLGSDQPQRFLPTRFDIDGNALDAKGFPSRILACPRCHLDIPRLVLEMQPFFISILGSPGCGKSYYLTAMAWQLRQLLPKYFGLVFADADPFANRALNDYEEALFLNPQADQIHELIALIDKTGNRQLVDEVKFGNQVIGYPRPFLFSVLPRKADARPEANPNGLLLCCYDNAGEHFQPGQDTTGSPVTQHVALSRLLLFLFDPSQDPRFRKVLAGRDASTAPADGRASRQESILHEMAARVRRYAGLGQSEKHGRPLTVVVTKFDLWSHLLDDADFQEPLVRAGSGAALDLDRIDRRSRKVRDLMYRLCPEIAAAAESFSNRVLYVPASALGQTPMPHPEHHRPALRPREIQPIWTAVPILHELSSRLPTLVPGYRRKATAGAGSSPSAGWAVRNNSLPD